MAHPTAQDVWVSMKAESPPDDLRHPNRQIHLTQEKKSFQVGRTSNRSADYTARPENGFVDSPVMSRKHAEIFADFYHQRVYVKDIGSLHGTFLNSTRLDAKAPHAIQNGDVVTFGVPVRSPPSGFIHPTTFKFGVDFGSSPSTPTSSPNKESLVFQVPDESSDSSESEMDVEYSRRVLNASGIRATKNVPIDLTGDSDVPASSQTVMDVEITHIRHLGESKASPVPIDVDMTVEELAAHDKELAATEDNATSEKKAAAAEYEFDGRFRSPLEDEDDYEVDRSIHLSDEYSSMGETSDEEPMHDDDEDSDGSSAHEEEEVNEVETPSEEVERLAGLSEVLRSSGTQSDDSVKLPPIRWPADREDSPPAGREPMDRPLKMRDVHPPHLPKHTNCADRDRAEFFAAREENRKRLSDGRFSQVVDAASAWTESGDRFLNSPDESNPPVDNLKRASPELDETSAHQFGLSKQKQASESQPRIEAKILSKASDDEDQAPTGRQLTPPSESKKRKADELSIDEMAVPESLPTPSASEGGCSSPIRPTKRLRNIANAVGLAAIGGVAGGIAIFSTLVASGPTFV